MWLGALPDRGSHRGAIVTPEAGTLAGIVQRLDAMQSTLAEISATSARGLVIQGATLDAAPVEHYDLLDMHTPRTQEDWETAFRSKWKLIRRRLVFSAGVAELPRPGGLAVGRWIDLGRVRALDTPPMSLRL